MRSKNRGGFGHKDSFLTSAWLVEVEILHWAGWVTESRPDRLVVAILPRELLLSGRQIGEQWPVEAMPYGLFSEAPPIGP